MCRIAAYLGEPISLEHFLVAPPHGLHRQSWAPRELTEATVNADGFGVGWYAPDGAPGVYTNTAPIWSDPNLDALGRSLTSEVWLGSVRSATTGMAVSHADTQPFAADGRLFTHNGFVAGFHHDLRVRLNRFLDDQYQSTILGTTDSAYLFALLRQELARDGDPPAAYARLCEHLDDWLGPSGKALLDFILVEEDRVFALRHGLGDSAPTLYYATDTDHFGEGQLIASEPLDDEGIWHTIPEGQILILERNRPPELQPLGSAP